MIETIIEMTNDANAECRATLLHELMTDLELRLCELDEDCICDECGECSCRCCMDSMKVCDSCLCC